MHGATIKVNKMILFNLPIYVKNMVTCFSLCLAIIMEIIHIQH